MFAWIVLIILIGIIASVIIGSRFEKERREEYWDSLVIIGIVFWILSGAYYFFSSLPEISPSQGGFWVFLILGCLTALLFFKFIFLVQRKKKDSNELDELLKHTGCRSTHELLLKIEKLENTEEQFRNSSKNE